MSTRWQSETAIIGRLRIRTPAGDATQQRIGAVLRNAELRPSRLAAPAILCLHRFRDPAPGIRWADYNDTYPPPSWQNWVTQELDRLVAQAVRPALTAVPGSAEAVLFADRAEMLACLALDWLSGIVRGNWWWATLLRRDDPQAVLAREWMSFPQFVPLAVEYLARRGHAASFASRISDELAGALLQRVLDTFGIQKGEGTPGGPQASLQDGLKHRRLEVAPGPVSIVAPWSSIVPEADAPGLTAARRVLLAQALMLRRASAVARSTAFQRAVAVWRTDEYSQSFTPIVGGSRAISPEMLDRPEPEKEAPSGTATVHEPSPESEAGRSFSRNDCSVDVEQPLQARIDTPRGASRQAKQKTRSRLFEGNSFGKTPQDGLPADSLSWAAPPVSSIVVPYHPVPANAETNPFTAHGAINEIPRVESSFAGVFFLINVALALGLYSDFTSPRGNNLEMNIWNFLCLLAAEFVGSEFQDDALPHAFDELAGPTPEQHPDASFHPPQKWQVPDEWLEPFPEPFEWKEEIHEGRVQVAHPAGFLLKDEPLQDAHEGATDLERWVTWVVSYIRARLERAIGRRDAAEFLCRVHGSIEISAMHVNVYYSLQNYPTEIRLAGLDRDPGWVPAAGRYVAYHFD
jgi:hypothetical protein